MPQTHASRISSLIFLGVSLLTLNGCLNLVAPEVIDGSVPEPPLVELVSEEEFQGMPESSDPFAMHLEKSIGQSAVVAASSRVITPTVAMMITATPTVTPTITPKILVKQSTKVQKTAEVLGDDLKNYRLRRLETYARSHGWVLHRKPEGVTPEVMGWWREWCKLHKMKARSDL